MCRLLYVKSTTQFRIGEHLQAFAELCKNNQIYQGHGWGCAFLQKNRWQLYHSITPIWQDNVQQFGESTLMLAHARSAFEDRDIRVENNMPFHNANCVFLFNGELRGVRIKATGRIGAEKVFNFILRLNKGDLLAALQKVVPIIEKRTNYVKAMNIIMADPERGFLSTTFNAEPDYFTLHRQYSAGCHIICSEPYPHTDGWQKIPNHTIEGF